MIKKLLFAVLILGFITVASFVPVMLFLLDNFNEDIVDTIYLDLIGIIWGFGLVLAIFWRW